MKTIIIATIPLATLSLAYAEEKKEEYDNWYTDSGYDYGSVGSTIEQEKKHDDTSWDTCTYGNYSYEGDPKYGTKDN